MEPNKNCPFFDQQNMNCKCNKTFILQPRATFYNSTQYQLEEIERTKKMRRKKQTPSSKKDAGRELHNSQTH